MNKYDQIQINTDGGSRGNPGPSAAGIYVSNNNQEICSQSFYLGVTTNNVAEYTAVIKALDLLVEKQIFAQHVSFVLDSELVVKQLNGQYKIKLPHLKDLNLQIKNKIANLISQNYFKTLSFRHTLRENNKIADQLVNGCLDSQ